MTEEGKSPNTNSGDFPSSLENAKNAFPTFPLPRLLLLNFLHPNPKGAFLCHRLLLFRLIFRLEKTD